jgi:hypothetical protein
MAHVVIDVLNPDKQEEKPKETADTQEKNSKRARRFVRKQVVTIDGQVVNQ